MLYLATREVATIALFFKKYKSILCFGGCNCMIYTKNEEFVDLVKTVVATNGLYLFRTTEIQTENKGRQGDGSPVS